MIIYQNCINLQFTCKGEKPIRQESVQREQASEAEGGFLVGLKRVCLAYRLMRWSLQNPSREQGKVGKPCVWEVSPFRKQEEEPDALEGSSSSKLLVDF